MKKRIFSRVLALFMALTLLSTTAFAASFTDLQEAIDGTNDASVTEGTTPVDNAGTADQMPEMPEIPPEVTEPTEASEPQESADDPHVNGALVRQENGIDYYGYGWDKVLGDDGSDKWYYAIEAWNATTGERCVVLFENVEFDKNGDDKDLKGGIVVEGENKNINLDLNGNNIDLNPGKDVNSEYIFGADFNPGSIITVNSGTSVTVNDAKNTGKITGGNTGVTVNKNGSFILNAGAISGNNQKNGKYGAGMQVYGTAIMNGGSIAHNNGHSGGGGAIVDQGGHLTVNGGSISENRAQFGGGIQVNPGCTLIMTGGSILKNIGTDLGGGIYVKGGKLNLKADAGKKVSISQNSSAQGGGIFLEGCSGEWEWSGLIMDENTATKFYGGAISASGISLKIQDSTFSHNVAKGGAGGFIRYQGPKLYMEDCIVEGDSATLNAGDVHIVKSPWEFKNVTLKDASLQYTFVDGANVGSPLDGTDYTVIFRQYGVIEADGFKVVLEQGTNEVKITYNGEPVNTVYDDNDKEIHAGIKTDDDIPDTEDMNLVFKLPLRLTRERPTEPTEPIVSAPDISLGDLPVAAGADAATTIEDEETPLAGLFTRADAIGYLWEHTGSPEAELSDFPDVPEDHYWATAIGWAQDMGIALPDKEGNFRPDDLVLLTSDEPEGELQEFLNRYAVFAGIELEDGELFIELEADADGIIMGEEAQVIFDEFFAKLEAALSEQAA